MPTNDAHDDGAGNASGSNEAHLRAEQVTLWLVEKREDGAIVSRPAVVTGEVIFGACLDPLPPELWERCQPFDDPADGDAVAPKEGA